MYRVWRVVATSEKKFCLRFLHQHIAANEAKYATNVLNNKQLKNHIQTTAHMFWLLELSSSIKKKKNIPPVALEYLIFDSQGNYLRQNLQVVYKLSLQSSDISTA